MRLGILGGSFDPVHNGHLAAARACLEAAPLDEVWFLPTASQPLKPAGPAASAEQRVEMLRLATDDEPRFRVCTLELERGGVSYSVDTITQLHEELPEAELYFILGADVLLDLPQWKSPDVIFHLATPLVVTRAGEPPPDLSQLETYCDERKLPRLIEMPPVDVSSREIRRRLRSGEATGHLIPAAVAAFAQSNRIYLELE